MARDWQLNRELERFVKTWHFHRVGHPSQTVQVTEQLSTYISTVACEVYTM